ncbi:MAG: putative toxin-antitoxin system toxin component, PIN family [Chloroflexota bacterium]
MIAELERVLAYPRIRQRYSISDEDVARLVTSLRSDALLVPGDYEIQGVAADPDDDKFLACALEGQVDCIVTGDPDLLNLKRFHGIDILSPHGFLTRLETRKMN